MPELHRLKISCLDANNARQRQLNPVPLKSLSYLSLKLDFTSFNQFAQLVKDMFHQVQFLSVATEGDTTYLNGNRWHHSNSLLNNGRNLLPYDGFVEKFASSFWIE